MYKIILIFCSRSTISRENGSLLLPLFTKVIVEISSLARVVIPIKETFLWPHRRAQIYLTQRNFFESKKLFSGWSKKGMQNFRSVHSPQFLCIFFWESIVSWLHYAQILPYQLFTKKLRKIYFQYNCFKNLLSMFCTNSTSCRDSTEFLSFFYLSVIKWPLYLLIFTSFWTHLGGNTTVRA